MLSGEPTRLWREEGGVSERSRLFQQTKHWLIALLFVVGACFCVLLCLAFPSILPEPVAKKDVEDGEGSLRWGEVESMKAAVARWMP